MSLPFDTAGTVVSVSLIARKSTGGQFICEGGESVGIDVSARLATPGDEVIRACIRLDGDSALAIELLTQILRGLEPFGVSSVPAPVRED